jgi:chemotaxis response regulator CheB
METIKELLAKLDNQVTPSMAKRLDGLQALQEKLKVAKEEYEADPSEKNAEDLQDVKDYIAEQMEEIEEDLKVLVRRKKFADEEEKASETTPKTGEAPKAGETTKEEAKEGLGVFGWVFGGVLLVASFGAINYWRNNK